MHIGPLCPGAHVVVATDKEGSPTMTRSVVKSSNSPVGVLFRNTSTKWDRRVAVVVLMGLDEDEDGDGTADSLYSRIKLLSTFFPTSTDVTLTVYSTVVMFMLLTERSVLGLPLVARATGELCCLALSSVMLSKVSVRDLSSVALTGLGTSRRSRLRFLMFCPAT